MYTIAIVDTCVQARLMTRASQYLTGTGSSRALFRTRQVGRESTPPMASDEEIAALTVSLASSKWARVITVRKEEANGDPPMGASRTHSAPARPEDAGHGEAGRRDRQLPNRQRNITCLEGGWKKE